MVVTEEVSQVLRGWLKEEAERNMEDIVVTEEVFQVEMLPLKEVA